MAAKKKKGGSKKNKKRQNFQFVSTGKTADGKPTGTFYTSDINTMNSPDLKELKKFDPRAANDKTGKVGAHVVFKRKKIPKG